MTTNYTHERTLAAAVICRILSDISDYEVGMTARIHKLKLAALRRIALDSVFCVYYNPSNVKFWLSYLGIPLSDLRTYIKVKYPNVLQSLEVSV